VLIAGIFPIPDARLGEAIIATVTLEPRATGTCSI
jgi:hypothetical protein